MNVIEFILNCINQFWDALSLVQLPYGFNLAQFFIGLLVLELLAEIMGIGLFGGHKEIK